MDIRDQMERERVAGILAELVEGRKDPAYRSAVLAELFAERHELFQPINGWVN